MIARAIEGDRGLATARLWEVALKETVWNCGFRFAPDTRLACGRLGIAMPEATRRFVSEGERFVAYGFALPEEAVAFLAYFAGTGFAARVSMPAEEIFQRLGPAPTSCGAGLAWLESGAHA